MSDIIYGVFSEAYARGINSYSRSLHYYEVRQADRIQPSTTNYLGIDLFNVRQQSLFLIFCNVFYLIVTASLLIYMMNRKDMFKLRWSTFQHKIIL